MGVVKCVAELLEGVVYDLGGEGSPSFARMHVIGPSQTLLCG